MAVSRRNFISKASSFTVASIGFPAIVSCRSPNSKISHAAIGTANMAHEDLLGLATHPKIEIAALCDIDADYLAAAKKEFPSAKVYRDWRELFEAEAGRIDSVNISIPDHNHEIAASAAIDRKLHVYLQKPLCKTIGEAERLRNAAARHSTVTQMGTQWFAHNADRQTVALLRSQALGPVEYACLFSSRGATSRRRRLPGVPAPVPKHVEWNLWLGAAAYREYCPQVYHPLIWRIWTDLGSGWIGDLCVHVFTALWAGMELGSVACNDVYADTLDDCAPELKGKVWPNSAHIVWNFPGVKASGGRPFKVEWFDGIDQEGYSMADAKFRVPKAIDGLWAKTPLGKRPFEGKAVKCEGGWILQPHSDTLNAYIVRNNGKVESALAPTAFKSHWNEFTDCCLYGGKASTDFAWSTWMQETISMGEIAEMLAGRKLVWDAAKRSFNDPEADKLLDSTPRTGW
jgi:predicted dehydrogenase